MKPEAAARDELNREVEEEQVRLSTEQHRRVALPHFIGAACVAWLGWHIGVSGPIAVIWLLTMASLQAVRYGYVSRLRRGRVSASARTTLQRFFAWLIAIGTVNACFIALIFTHPLQQAHFLLTMILLGNAAGTVSVAAGRLRVYVGWAIVYGGTLTLAWLLQGTLESAAVAALLAMLFAVLCFYVRDQGRSMLEQVSLSDSLRRERDRAERASVAKTRFFAAASHDLRQPLTALAYNAATVQALAEQNHDATLAGVGDGIRRALAESRALLDSLLEVSELDAGAVDLHLEDAALAPLIERLCEECAPLARERGLRLACLQPATGCAVRTDVGLLRRVLQNLVGNAIKFTESGSVTIEVDERLEAGRSVVAVSVRDTGPGISAIDQERIFDEFYQVGNAERNRTRGLGLGLAIVRRLAHLIGASIAVTSRVGSGSRFTLTLPVAQGVGASRSRAIEVEAEALTEEPRRVGRVLLIDDEPEIRAALQTLLGTLGWEVLACASGGQALDALGTGYAPDVLLVDFRLQDGSCGLEALQAMRAQGCAAPAVLVTGDTAPSRIIAARAAGVPVLYKPVDGLELAALLSRMIAGESNPRAA